MSHIYLSATVSILTYRVLKFRKKKMIFLHNNTTFLPLAVYSVLWFFLLRLFNLKFQHPVAQKRPLCPNQRRAENIRLDVVLFFEDCRLIYKIQCIQGHTIKKVTLGFIKMTRYSIKKRNLRCWLKNKSSDLPCCINQKF